MIDAATVRRVAQSFDVPAPIDSVTSFGGGLINDTFLVTTDDTDYVMQRINRAVFGDASALMQNIATVSAHLDGRFVPRLVSTRGREWFVTEGDDAWRMWHRVAGREPAGPPTPARVGSAARLLGRFHAALADLDPGCLTETIPHFHDPVHRLAALRDAIERDPVDRVGGVTREIDVALAAAPRAEHRAERIAYLPRRVAHNDAALTNFLFVDDEAVCLVDLDTLMPTAWFWDVGDLVRTASIVGAEDDPDPAHHRADPELVRAILAGYRAGIAPVVTHGAAEDDVLEIAGSVIAYEQALRFLTDWILGDPYYRTTRAGQNLDRARGQLVLFESLHGTVSG